MKKMFFLFVLLLSFACGCMASTKSAEHPAADTVSALIAAEDAEDWDTYVELWCQSERDSYMQMVQNHYKQANRVGIVTVKSPGV